MLARRPLAWLALAFLAGVMTRRWMPDSFVFAWRGGAVAAVVSAVVIALAAAARRIAAGRAARDGARAPREPAADPAPSGGFGPRPPAFASDSPLLAKPLAWHSRHPALALAGLGLLCLAAGFWRQDGAWRLGAERFARWPGRGVAMARVRAPPEAALAVDAPRFWRVGVDVERIAGDEPPGGAATVELLGRGPANFRRGDLLFFSYIKPPAEIPACPGAFDAERWRETRGLAGALRLTGAVAVQPLERPGAWTGFLRRLDAVRRMAVRRTLASFPGEDARLLAAVLYGYRGEMADETRLAFRRVGLAHLLAISGLHVSLVVGLFWLALAPVMPGRRARALAGIAVALLYLGLSGAAVAACRATLMTAVYLGGHVVLRRSDVVNSLGASALLLLAFNPAWAVDLGFQLSFIAVLFISRGHRELSDLLVRARLLRPEQDFADSPGEDGGAEAAVPTLISAWMRQPCLRRIGNLAGMTLTAWIGNAPLVLYAFGQASPVGLGVNMLAIPLSSLVLAGGMALPLAWLLPAPWADWLALPLLAPAKTLLWLTAAASRLPAGSWNTAFPAWGWVFGFYAGSGLWLARRSFPGAWRGLAGAAGLAATLACAGGCIASARTRPAPEGGRATLLPGRNGGVMVLEAPDGVVSAIGPSDRNSVWTLASYLKSSGRLRLDHYVVLSDAPAPARRPPGEAPAPCAEAEIPSEDIDSGDRSGLAELFSFTPGLRTTAIPRRQALSGPAPSWGPIPGPPGVEGLFSRGRDGALLWWAVRLVPPASDGRALTLMIADGPWPAQLLYRLRRNPPGAGGVLADLRVRGRPTRAMSEAQPGAWLFWRGGAGDAAGWRREDWGALRIAFDPAGGRPAAQAYDGRAWRAPPPARSITAR